MDIQLIGFISVVETVVMTGLKESWNLATTPRSVLIQIFLELFLVQYLVVKLYRIFIYPFYVSPLRHLPTPKGNQFLIGQLKNQFYASSPNELYLKWANQYPDSPFIRYFGLFNHESLLVNGVEAHREVFQTHCYSFQKPGFFMRFVGEIAGTGLLFAEGAVHRKQRKMIMNAFSIPNIKKMFPVFQERAKLLSQYLAENSIKSPDHTLEVQAIYAKATIDIIGVTALGVDLENLKSSILKMDFLQCYRRMFEQSPLSAFISFVNIHFPIRRLLPFVKANTEYVLATQEVRRMLRECIRNRIRTVHDAEKSGATALMESRDLLTYMVEDRIEGPDALTVEDILGHLLNFLSAGHETTATALTWASYILAIRPEIQERLRAEIQELLERKPVPDYSDIERMTYIHNFLRELLRVYSPAVGSHRSAATDVTVCGTQIPKGTHLVLCPSVTNLSERIWGADAAVFDPDRWDRLTGEAATPYSVMTFINGPRVCIGKQYAYVEIKVLLIELLKNFRLLPSAEIAALGDRMVPLKNPGVVLRPEGGLRIKLEKI